MRHGKSGRKFSLESAERMAFFRNITDSLIVSGKIKTTVTRAKEIRKFAERMVTLAKDGTLASKRRALSFLRTKEAFVRLFGEYAERYKDRNGGYTRITKAGYRVGDNAPMAYLEFITSGDTGTEKKDAPKRKRRRSSAAKKAEGTTKETKVTKEKTTTKEKKTASKTASAQK
jgi:large subunit ribosomal protein L17